jgi:uncharacterized membrane protein
MARKTKLVIAAIATLLAVGSVAAPAQAAHADRGVIFCC